MKCLCIGICQVEAISKILKLIPEFNSIYDELHIYVIFQVSIDEMIHILNDIVPNMDLVISQPVSQEYRENEIFSTHILRERVNASNKPIKHLIVSNCYFTGYDPIPFQTTDTNGQTIQCQDMSYFPSQCLKAILDADIQQACKDWCNIDIYTEAQLSINYQKSINELISRENKVFAEDYGIDIRISDYIAGNYKTAFLFHTYNHPTNLLLFELTYRILQAINISATFTNLIDDELLGDISLPPPPSVYFKNNMTFTYPKFYFDKKTHTTKEAMLALIEKLKDSDNVQRKQWLDTIQYAKDSKFL